MKKQTGFTLIELVVVIVILGILAVAATAKFQDLTTQANDAVEKGIAGELASASAINYATRAVDSTAGVALNGTNVCTNAILGSLLIQGLPADVTIGGTGNCSATGGAGPGGTVSCTVTKTGGSATNATATIICSN